MQSTLRSLLRLRAIPALMQNQVGGPSAHQSHLGHRLLLENTSKDFRNNFIEQRRWRSTTPMNTVIMFVPQQEAWVVERMGKYHRITQPGLNILMPIIDKVKYVQTLKEIAIDIPKQSAITLDNVTLSIDGVLYLKVLDPFKASYGVEDPEFAITQLAQTTMRSELGKITLDSVFRERESLNVAIVGDIKLPPRVQEAMQMQVEAERKKRAAVLESEGVREADINVAEGKKRARILSSEADKTEQINIAQGEAAALLAKAEARAKSVEMIAQALLKDNGMNAASLNLAEQYVRAYSKLAKTSNTVILPSNPGDVNAMVTQAVAIFQSLARNVNSQQPSITERNEFYSDDEDIDSVSADQQWNLEDVNKPKEPLQ